MVERQLSHPGSSNGRGRNSCQFPLETLFGSDGMLDKASESILPYARRKRVVVAWLNIERGMGSDQDESVWETSLVIHRQASLFLIAPAKLKEGKGLTREKVEQRVRETVSKLVKDNGGTAKQERKLADFWINLTKTYQRQRGVKETPFGGKD